MGLTDYSDEDDYYSQGFEKAGVVSIWVGLSPVTEGTRVDVLQDLCGVGYYNLDNQEANARPETVSFEELLGEISYSNSFKHMALSAAQRINAMAVAWTIVQFDFSYDQSRVQRPISEKAVFLGVFPYAIA